MNSVRMFAALIFLVSNASTYATSLRFFGNGPNDIDRVKIQIDNPNDNNPGPPADVGNQDFTVEFWVQATNDNQQGLVNCGSNNNWVTGNQIIDRDRFGQGREWGISLGLGRLVFGTSNLSAAHTICGSKNIIDGQWHHVAAQRRRSDGRMWLWVDGVLEAEQDGPDGDISYPDDGVPLSLCGPSATASCNFSDPYLVIGAEKHDAPTGHAFSGWVDEIRISTVLRYSSTFTPPSQAFAADNNTAALYHFDEGSGDFIGDSAFGSLSPGERRLGGSPAGPMWDSASPFSAGGSAGSIQLSSSNYSVDENDGSVTITATRVGGSTGAASVTYVSSNGTATSGADYQSASGTLNWADGDSATKTFTLSIIDDADLESNETVNLSLSNVTGGASLGSPSSAVLMIVDNETPSPGQLQLSAANYSVGESDGGRTITVNRAGGTDGVISVNYAVSDGTSTSGTDYQPSNGTLTWGDGDAAGKTFVIQILDDADVEGNETATISLSGATGGAALGNPSTAQLTIVDNDVNIPGSLQLTSATFSVGEGAGTAVISVNRAGGADGAVSVSYASSNGTATSGADYQSASGTLNWADGDSATKTFTVSIIDDADLESNETVNLSLSNVTGGASLGSPSSAVLMIVDNETPSPGQLQLSAANYSVGESDGGRTITVNRAGGTDGVISVNYAVSGGTSTSGTDYQPSNGTLTWGDGDAAGKTFVIQILDDADVEGNETATISLSGATGGAALGNPSTAQLTIVDNDVNIPGSLQLTSATFSVGEGAGTAVISVNRAGGADGAVSVSYASSNGTATSGADYQSASGTLNWADGDSATKTFTVSIIDDADLESNETVNLSLSNVTGGASLGSPSSAVLMIVDNETPSPGQLQLSAANYSVGESDGGRTITVNRAGGTDGVISVNYAVSGGTSTSGTDYQPSNGTLTWGDGDAAGKTFVIQILDDADVEGNETATISLSGATGGATLGNPSTAQLTIVDDDLNVPGELTLSSQNYSVGENLSTIQITVLRENGSDGAASTDFSVVSGTAQAGVDFQLNNGTLSWVDGDVEPKTFDIQIINDADLEGDETVNITLINVTGANAGTTLSAILTITDDEVASPGTLQLSASTYSASEATASVVVTATRTGGSSGAVSVDISFDDVTANLTSDYQAADSTFSWQDGDASSKSISITILDDALVEGDESVSIQLSSPAGGAVLGSPASAILTIVDNDMFSPGNLQFTTSSYSANENAGTVRISVSRTGGTDGVVSIVYATLDGSATEGVDYQGGSGTLTWSDGDGSAQGFDVVINDDDQVEPSETLQVSLRNPQGGVAVGSPDSAIIEIIDDEIRAPLPAVNFGGGGALGLIWLFCMATISLLRLSPRRLFLQSLIVSHVKTDHLVFGLETSRRSDRQAYQDDLAAIRLAAFY